MTEEKDSGAQAPEQNILKVKRKDYKKKGYLSIWQGKRGPKKRAKSVTLPDGTIEIYDADGKRTAVIV